MDCREYVESYLTAHSDGELDAVERSAADAHLEGCQRCRARLDDERALKALLKHRLRKAAIPVEVRAAIRASLDRAEVQPSLRERLGSVAVPSLRRTSLGLTAIAAVVLFALLIRGWTGRPAPASDLDLVVQAFGASEQHFAPDPLCWSSSSVAAHYHSAQMPSFIWNFEPLGFHLVGGRIGNLSDGRAATLTLYRGIGGAVMCIRFHAPNFKIPPGGHPMIGDSYAYSYQGCSLVLTVNNQWICVLVSRLPEAQFEKDINYLES